MSSKLQVYCEALAEASWLAAVITIPLFFNISSAEVFEPDKMFMLKFLAVLSGAACLLKRIVAEQPQKHAEGNVLSFPALLKHPLAASILVLAAVYTLSSLFSIMPFLSWFGLYKRAQGTLAFYCYVVLFLAVLSELRSSAQLRRLQYAFILTSFPIAAYTVLQHFGMDPLPWSALRGRASANMGNPIFLGAYLIMVIPLTTGRLIDAAQMLRTDSNRKAGFVLACCCGLALALQGLALFYAQSRGPIIGLAVAGYICLFLFLALKRTALKERAIYPVMAAGLGLLAPICLFLVARIVSGIPAAIAAPSLAGAFICVAFVYWAVWRTAWGKSWLWLTWLVQTVVLITLFVGAPARILSENKMFSSLGRLGQLSSDSVDVRRYLWQTGLHTMRSVSPPILPGNRRDVFHYLRPVIGYGPENTWFAANLYADPELTKRHTGETVDRLHNETFENLVTLGFAGAALWLIIIAAAFYYSLRLLGFPGKGRDRRLFILFSTVGILAGILLPWATGSLPLAGVGVIAGLLVGIIAFAAWSGYRNLHAGFSGSTRQIFVFSILGALIAHFAETGVGIAVTPTRMYFFLLVALVSAFASKDLNWIEAPAKQHAGKPAKKLKNPLFPLTVLSSFVVLILSWCFVINTSSENSALAIFLRTWFTAPAVPRSGLPLPGSSILLLVTVCGGLGLMYGELVGPQAHKFPYRKTAGILLGFMISAWLLMGILSAEFWTASESPSPMDVSLHSEARMTLFMLGLFLMILATAWSLIAADTANDAGTIPVRARRIGFGILVLVCTAGIIREWVARPAWADIAYRVARFYESSRNPEAAIQLYERASKLAPRVVRYWISKGLIQASNGAADAGRLQESIQSLQHALDLNPLDPSSWRNIGSVYMRAGEHSADPSTRTVQINKAISFFQQAAQLAPNFPDAYCEWGRCYFLLGDQEEADGLYQKSLQMNPNYARTYMFLGEMHYRLKSLERACQDFTAAVKLSGGNIEARRNAGFLLALLGRRDEAIGEYIQVLKHTPQDAVVLRRLSSLYFSKGDPTSGFAFAQRAYDATPAAERGSFEAFVANLQQK